MYKISVPITTETLERYDKTIYINYLKEIDTDRVFLCPAGNNGFWDNYESELLKINDATDLFHSFGFEVGVWVWAFCYEKECNYTFMKSPGGRVSKMTVCPTDEEYKAKMGQFVKDAAKCGIDLFQFDDDYRYGFQDIGIGCCCDNHLKMIGEFLQEDVSIETMANNLLYGGRNKYRTAFIKANGKALEDFADYMRKNLDEVNPNCRMGFCSCISSWDADGTNPEKIAKILAGKTKPFYRLIGAPYWANERNWGNRLADIIELERTEAARRKDNNIEIFSEGDTFPRPRFKVPAAYLEIFDTALRVAGCTDGILKYSFDYHASPNYETGYISKHIKNKPLYNAIDKMFSDKNNIGVKVWDKENKYEDALIPKEIEGTDAFMNYAFSPAVRLLNACSFPITYDDRNSSIGIAFGEDIKIVPDKNLYDGLIIDIRAAEILKENGIDTGLISKGKTYKPKEEIYYNSDEHVSLSDAGFSEVTLNENVQIESYAYNKENLCPASYRYENKDGQRFLVYCFNAYFNNETIFRNYERAKQINAASVWLSGKTIPVTCTGHPDLYIQAKRNKKSIAVALWNIFPDEIEKPIVELDFTPSNVNTINCSATIDKNKIILSQLPPYGFCAFEAE